MKVIPLDSQVQARTGYSHKVIIGYKDLTTAGLTQTLTIFPDSNTLIYGPTGTSQTQSPPQLPQGFSVRKAAVYATTLFAGPSLSSMQVSIGDAGSSTRQITNTSTDLFTTGTANTKNPVLGSTPYAFAASDVAANSLVQAAFTSVGCNLSALTAGQVEVYLELVDLNDLVAPLGPTEPYAP